MTDARQGVVFAVIAQALIIVPFVTTQGQVQPGTRIRVRTDSIPKPRVGTLISMDTDSLRFQSAKDSAMVAVRSGSLVRLEQSRGSHHDLGHGAGIGALVGAGTGLVLGLIASTDSDSWVEIGAGEIAAVTVFFGGVGAGIGLIAGAASTRERWETVPLPGNQATAPQSSTVVGVSLNY